MLHRASLTRRFRLSTAALTSTALLAGAAVAPASAQSGCTGQAGTSAIEQYCEAVPNGDGSRTKSTSKSDRGTSKSTSQSLQSAGPDGAAVAALAGGTGGGSGGTGGSGSSDNSKSAAGGELAVKSERVSGPDDPGSNPLNAATQAASSGPIAGKAVTWGLVGLTGLGALGALLLRRRSLQAASNAGSDTTPPTA